MILLPDIPKVPARTVHQSADVALERFHHRFGFLRENQRLSIWKFNFIFESNQIRIHLTTFKSPGEMSRVSNEMK